MSVDDHGLEAIRKSAEEVTPGNKSNYYIKTQVYSVAGTSSGTNSRPAVNAATSTVILAANLNRKFAIIFNNNGKQVFIKLGASAVNNEGIRINANDSFILDSSTQWTGTVNAIFSTGTGVIDVFEAT